MFSGLVPVAGPSWATPPVYTSHSQYEVDLNLLFLEEEDMGVRRCTNLLKRNGVKCVTSEGWDIIQAAEGLRTVNGESGEVNDRVRELDIELRKTNQLLTEANAKCDKLTSDLETSFKEQDKLRMEKQQALQLRDKVLEEKDIFKKAITVSGFQMDDDTLSSPTFLDDFRNHLKWKVAESELVKEFVLKREILKASHHRSTEPVNVIPLHAPATSPSEGSAGVSIPVEVGIPVSRTENGSPTSPPEVPNNTSPSNPVANTSPSTSSTPDSHLGNSSQPASSATPEPDSPSPTRLTSDAAIGEGQPPIFPLEASSSKVSNCVIDDLIGDVTQQPPPSRKRRGSRNNTPKGLFKCLASGCHAHFSSLPSLKKHVKGTKKIDHDPSSLDRYKTGCKDCGSMFVSESEYTRHRPCTLESPESPRDQSPLTIVEPGTSPSSPVVLTAPTTPSTVVYPVPTSPPVVIPLRLPSSVIRHVPVPPSPSTVMNSVPSPTQPQRRVLTRGEKLKHIPVATQPTLSSVDLKEGTSQKSIASSTSTQPSIASSTRPSPSISSIPSISASSKPSTSASARPSTSSPSGPSTSASSTPSTSASSPLPKAGRHDTTEPATKRRRVGFPNEVDSSSQALETEHDQLSAAVSSNQSTNSKDVSQVGDPSIFIVSPSRSSIFESSDEGNEVDVLLEVKKAPEWTREVLDPDVVPILSVSEIQGRLAEGKRYTGYCVPCRSNFPDVNKLIEHSFKCVRNVPVPPSPPTVMNSTSSSTQPERPVPTMGGKLKHVPIATQPPSSLVYLQEDTSHKSIASSTSTATKSVRSPRSSTSKPQPSTSSSTRPSTSVLSIPSTSASSIPSTSASSIPSTSVSSIPSTSVLSISGSARPSTSASARPSTSASARPLTAASARPLTAASARPLTAASARPSTSAPSRPSTSAPSGPSTSAPSGPSTSASSRPSTSDNEGCEIDILLETNKAPECTHEVPDPDVISILSVSSRHGLLPGGTEGGSRAKKYVCRCGSKFPDLRKLTAHIDESLYGRIFECKSCGEGFYNLAALSLHMRSAHGCSAEKDGFCCGLCGEDFIDARLFNKHKEKEHAHL